MARNIPVQPIEVEDVSSQPMANGGSFQEHPEKDKETTIKVLGMMDCNKGNDATTETNEENTAGAIIKLAGIMVTY